MGTRSKRLQSTLSPAAMPEASPAVVAAAGLRRRIADEGAHWRSLLLPQLRNVSAEGGAVASFAAVVLYDLMGAHAGEDACRAGMLSGGNGCADIVRGLADGCMHDVKGIRKYSLAALALVLRGEPERVRADAAVVGRVLEQLVEGVGGLHGDVQCLVVEAVHWATACVPGGMAGAVDALRGSGLCAQAMELVCQK